MTTNTGQQAKRARDYNAGAGKSGQDTQRRHWGATGRTRKRGHDGQNMTEGQGS
jgi:hypothetical protein